jgi:hypothetical protein
MGSLEWLVFLGFFGLGYGVYWIGLICKEQLEMLEQIRALLDR